MGTVTPSLAEARSGDERAFADLIAGYRHELQVHCYRILGSNQDAEDALQETLTAAWRGLKGLEHEAALRSWLYRIATRCSLRLAEKRPRRVLSWDHGPARSPAEDLGEPVEEPIWLEPWIPTVSCADDPASRHADKEAVGLAYVAALQNLPPNQRAVLILREVLGFSAAEVAELLDTSVASVNSALQRARATLSGRAPALEEQSYASDREARDVVAAFVAAFDAGDVDAVVALLSADVRFTMPPLPAWFDGRDAVGAFLGNRVFATAWRAVRLELDGTPSLGCYQQRDGVFRLSALMLLDVAGGRITWIASFLDPALLRRLGLPQQL